MDLHSPEVRQKLIRRVRAGEFAYLHVGLPCRTWGPAGRLAGGTRRCDRPLGDGTLARELQANAEWAFVVSVWAAAVLAGTHVSLENPFGSYVFSTPHFELLRQGSQVHVVHLDQCHYRLKIPGCGPSEFCRKRTTVVGTSPALLGLGGCCPGIGPRHRHVRAWGHATVRGKSASRTAAAGVYPPALCGVWAQGTKAILQEPPQVLSRPVLVRLADQHDGAMLH